MASVAEKMGILWFCFVVLVSVSHSIEAFQQPRHVQCRHLTFLGTPSRHPAQSLNAASSPFVLEEETFFSHQDKNGKNIIVDSVVRVAAPGLKAYQVNKAGYGSYNDAKEFVPSDEVNYLLLPEGLRGKVQRVYDENVISANFPVLVKFTPAEHTEEGYDVPVPFLMHFLPEEVECV